MKKTLKQTVATETTQASRVSGLFRQLNPAKETLTGGIRVKAAEVETTRNNKDTRSSELRRKTRSEQRRAKRATELERASSEPEEAPVGRRTTAGRRSRLQNILSSTAGNAQEGDETSRSTTLRQRRGQGGSVLKPGLTSMARPADRSGRASKVRQALENGGKESYSSRRAPVQARVGMPGVSSPRLSTQAPRRRYDIALNIPGAEVRLPAMPEVHFGWRLASAALAVMMLSMLYMMFMTPAFKVESVQVTGLQRLTAPEVNLMLGLAGETIFAVDPKVIYTRLEEAFPELAEIDLTIGLPAVVALDLVERTPVIAWVEGNEEFWVDAEGISFEPRGEVESLLRVNSDGLPVDIEMVGLNQKFFKLKPALVATMLAMQKYLPEEAELVFSPDRGFGWHDNRGWDAYFGTTAYTGSLLNAAAPIDQIDQKLVVYQTLVDALNAQHIQPALISVEFLHAPYYRLER